MDRGVWQTTVHEITRVRQDLATKPPALLTNWGFPGGSDSKVSACSGRPRFDPWVRKMPWRREWLPTPVFLPGEFQGQKNLVGKVSDLTEQHFHFLFKDELAVAHIQMFVAL